MGLTQGRKAKYRPGIYVPLPPVSCTRALCPSPRCCCVVSVVHSAIPRTIGYMVRLLLRGWGCPLASLDLDREVESASQNSLPALPAVLRKHGRVAAGVGGLRM